MGQAADWMNTGNRQDDRDDNPDVTMSAYPYTDPAAYTDTNMAADTGMDTRLDAGADTSAYGYGYTATATAASSETESTGDEDNIEGAEEIRANIEQTRSEMTETINAIQEKLSPQHLVEQAKDSIREATVGRVEEMVSNVGDKVGEVAEQAQDAAGGLLDTIKQNPLPAALAGAGLAWLFMKGNGGSQSGASGYNMSQGRSNQAHPQYPYPVYPSYGASGSEYRGGQGSSGGGILDTIKQNPIPFGLAGLGLWALMGNKGGSSSSSGSQSRVQGSSRHGYGSQGYGGNQGYRTQDSGGQSLGDTVGQVGEKIGNVAGNAGDKVGQVAGDARDKVGEIAGQAAQTVGDVAGNVGGAIGDVAGNVGSAVGTAAGAVGSTAGSAAGAVGGAAGDLLDLVRRNPLQSAIAGLSIGWLLLNGREGSRGGDRIVQGAGDTVGNVVGGAGEKVGDFAGQAQSQVERTLLENPLVVGAAAMALGAAVGIALPETEQEHKVMGQARDSIVEKAQSMAQDTLQKVQRVAEEVTSTVKDTVQTEAESQGLVGSTT